MKKILAMGIIGMFLITGIVSVSASNPEGTGTKINQPLIISLNNYNPIVNLNDFVNFEILVADSNGKAASFLSYNVYTSPFEKDISFKQIGDKIVGKFTATRTGTYSLIVEITGADKIVEKEIFYYIVGPYSTEEITYYIRGIVPIHNLAKFTEYITNGTDWGSLLFTPPESIETRSCANWVQFTPDELPINPISIITNIGIHCWYKFDTNEDLIPAYRKVGIQKRENFNFRMDKSQIVPFVNTYTWIDSDFSVHWSMYKARKWYKIAVKLSGFMPVIMTKPEEPSYVDFTRIYSKNLNIISNSNEDVTVLSATSEASNLDNVKIVLQGTGTTNLVVQMSDSSKIYSAKLNGAKCNLAQTNGKLNINLNLDSGHTEQSLCIYFSQSSPSQQSQQSSQQSQSNPSPNQQQISQQIITRLFQNLILRHQTIN